MGLCVSDARMTRYPKSAAICQQAVEPWRGSSRSAFNRRRTRSQARRQASDGTSARRGLSAKRAGQSAQSSLDVSLRITASPGKRRVEPTATTDCCYKSTSGGESLWRAKPSQALTDQGRSAQLAINSRMEPSPHWAPGQGIFPGLEVLTDAGPARGSSFRHPPGLRAVTLALLQSPTPSRDRVPC